MKPPSEPRPLWSAEIWRRRAKDGLTRGFSNPISNLLAGLGITPNKVSLSGAATSFVAAHFISKGRLKAGGVLVLIAGVFDLIDGALARATGQKTRFGAVLDSTLDRVSEAAVLLGLLMLYTGRRSTPMVLLVYATLIGSILVSYIKARAEGMGVECNVGILTRSERVVLMALGLLLEKVPPALLTIALLSYLTAWQRLRRVQRASEGVE